MDYTQREVDRILDASEKRLMPDGKLELDGVWGLEGSRLAVVGAGYNCHIAGIEAIENKATIDLMLGAPILAEEVKRLREENKRVQSESDYYKAQLGAMYFRPS